ncbi:MAG: hypothetical protein IJR66_03790 [Clostridia bacterium]|nr:hypothetical protein [Clostridia bacterium]
MTLSLFSYVVPTYLPDNLTIAWKDVAPSKQVRQATYSTSSAESKCLTNGEV